MNLETILSTNNIIALNKLQLVVRKHHGRHFNLSEEQSVTALIKLSDNSSNEVVKDTYVKFLNYFDDEAIQTLKNNDLALFYKKSLSCYQFSKYSI